MSSETETGVSLDGHLFQLTCLVSASDIRLSARSEVGGRQLLALVMGSGDLTFHYLSEEMGPLPVLRRVPWFVDSNKRITALCFDPSGSWLLVAGNDGTIFIVPALSLVDPNAVLDHRWSTTDLTTFPSPLVHTNPSSTSSNTNVQRSHPTSIVWWQSLLECHHLAIMGTDCGDLIFVSLTTGLQVGITFVRAAVSVLHICQDNSLDSIFLLITSDKRSQWKLLLEQRATGYGWPIDSSGSAVKVVTSNNDHSSSSNTSLDVDFGNRSGSHLPTARSRLQGLKQLSVEKLTSLRQRLAETRSKGAAAMAVNIHFRRESSGSSSDDTTCPVSTINKPAAIESSDLPQSHHVTTGPQPERLSSEVGDTFLCPQYARGRHLLSGYYAPTSILSIHGMSLDVVPLFVHKLTPQCKDVLVTDRFLYVTNTDGKSLSVVSCQLSESRLDGDADYNPDSVIETYKMKGSEERILSVYKRTQLSEKRPRAGVFSKQPSVALDKDSNPQTSYDSRSRGSSREKERKSSQIPFSLPKNVKEVKLDVPSIDTCVIVTTSGIYEITLRISPAEVFMDLVLTHHALEKAEKLALVFGLNLQNLLETAGDIKLSNKEFPQAISLYKLSRCRHLKSVLKFAAAGHAAELLSYITLLFSTAGLDLTTSERIHLSNLAVMSHTEQVLRAIIGRVNLFKQFLKFLRENLYYDEVLAVNVAGQTGLWEVLQFLASYRGLHPEVLDILTKIVRSLGEGLMKAVMNKASSLKLMPALDSGLWLCVSDPSLLQSLLAKPQQARIHLQFVRTCLPHLEQFALQRLAALYDPSSPQLRPSLKRMFKIGRRRAHSSGSYSMQMDSLDLMESVDEIFVPGEDIIQTFLLVLLHLSRKRQVASFVYVPELMEKIQLAKDEDDEEDSEDLCPSLPVHTNTMSAGFSHVALVRNGAVYTWGNAVQGCLGAGPTMSKYSCPQQISMLPSLKLEVISVSCGRQHTLALTNNGVYAWGSSQYGQLGIGKTGQSPYPRLVEHLSRERIIAVSTGQYHSTALADDGRVFTWGWGVHGQLGHHSVEDCHVPTLVERLIGKVVTQICGGHGHTLVLTAEGQVYTFGSSVFGQLGNGTNVKSSVPIHVVTLMERITMIATNYFHNLAVSSNNKLYVWGSSPQVLRLQAQAQKKARLLQQQQPSSCSVIPDVVTPSSPSCPQSSPSRSTRPASAQLHSTVGINSEVSGSVVESSSLPKAAKSDHVIINIVQYPHESSSTYHNPTFSESSYGELPNQNLKQSLKSCDSQLSVDGSCVPSANLKSQDPLADRNVNMKTNMPSHSQLPSPLLNNNADSLNSSSSTPNSDMKSSKCHKFSSENSSNVSVVDNKQHVNIQEQSSQKSYEIQLSTGERVCETDVRQISKSKKHLQDSQSNTMDLKQRFQLSSGTNKSSWMKNTSMSSPILKQHSDGNNTQLLSSSVFSDFENANTNSSSGDLQHPSNPFMSRKLDQCLDLKVKPTYPPLTTTTAEGYSIPTLIVSPSMEFKGLTARRSPSLDTNFDPNNPISSNQSTRSDPDDGQTHLTPQLVDTSLVLGPIVQVSCGCHHSALLTREGVLYMWGRNLDGQLGNGTRKEIPIPTPLTSPPAATSNTKGSSSSSHSSTVTKSPSVSGIVGGGEKLRLRQVCCGCEFTVAQENATAGKIWAWGNNSQAQLGRAPVEDSKALEGKLVMLKTTKRVIKLPHGSQNSSDAPREVPGLPSSTISFKYDTLSGISGWCGYLLGTCTELCPPLCSIEVPCYGLRTLHYALQHFYGHYDSTYLLNKCLELENYQGAAKLAALDRHYHLALAYQLKALALATMEHGFNANKQTENQRTNVDKETNERNSNKIFANNVTTSNDANGLAEDKLKNRNVPLNSNRDNNTKDRNSNPTIESYRQRLQDHIASRNSKHTSIQHSEPNSNVEIGSTNNQTRVTDSAKILTEINSAKDSINCTEVGVNGGTTFKETAQNNEIKNETAVIKNRIGPEDVGNIGNVNQLHNVSENSENKIEVISKPNTENELACVTEIENRNQRNSKILLVCHSNSESESNQAPENDNISKEKSKVEFSDEISTLLNPDLKPDSKLPLKQPNANEKSCDLEKDEAFTSEKDVEELKQETKLSVKSVDHSSNKTSPIEEAVEDVETSSSISTPESLTSTNAPDSEMHAFAVQGGTEQMSEGHRYLTSPDSSTSPLVSEEQGLLSPEPFLSQTSEQTSENTDVNLVPINENGEIQSPAKVSSEADKIRDLDNQNKNLDQHETDSVTDVTALRNSDSKLYENSESLIKSNQENLLHSSDLRQIISTKEEFQSNSDSFTPIMENTNVCEVKHIVAVESNDDCDKKTNGVLNEVQNNELYGQNIKSETKLTTTEMLNSKTYELNKPVEVTDSDTVLEIETVLYNVECSSDSDIKADRSTTQHKEKILSRLSECKNSDLQQESGPPVAEDITVSKALSSADISTGIKSTLTSIQNDAISGVDEKPTVKELKTDVRSILTVTKQSSSDRTDLENYENELKVSSGNKDIRKIANNDASKNSARIVKNEVSKNSTSALTEKLKSYAKKSVETGERNDLITLDEATPSKPASEGSPQLLGSVTKTVDNGSAKQLIETAECKDLVAQAASVVEYYVSVMEEDSHTMMSRLLQQGIEFWLSHSLPVDHLENLLLKHMSKFFYPLGLLLFCNDSNTGEEQVETKQQAVSMLNHLSTRFCLQLCSSLLSHIDQRKAYPEYIELLAQVTSMQTAPGLNGCCITSQNLSQSPEQLMESILEGLGATKGLGGPFGQTYINLQEEVMETDKDPSSETTKLEQFLAFSCGHNYGWSVFHQSVLPELELGLLQLHHPLPNTARVLKGLFGSNSPNLHLACPRCVLSYLQSQTTPPL